MKSIHAKPKIIGLTGHMGAGKDAAGALLSMVGYQRVAFADEVRKEVAAEILNPSTWGLPVEISVAFALATEPEVWAKPTADHVRRILQWWGTEYRRSQNENYWIDKVHGVLAGPGHFVVTDVRFPNEAALLRGLGGEVWRIERDVEMACGIPGHASEVNVDEINADRVISNCGTLCDLASAIRGEMIEVINA